MTPDDAIARRSGPIRRSWLASRCRAGETILELPTPTTSLDQAAEAAAQYRRASRSENPRRAYRAAVAGSFERFL